MYSLYHRSHGQTREGPNFTHSAIITGIDSTQVKTERGEDDTIMDDVAAQVYVEQFALETFQRAENAMRASKASR